MTTATRESSDTAALRKARGAFFTPPAIASYIAAWAVRTPSDRVLEPSAGDAEFLVHAVEQLRRRGCANPRVWGCELHEWSAKQAERRVLDSNGTPHITVGDFFQQETGGGFDVVIGNPPYIRFQDFAGDQRVRAKAAALRGGVALSGLASSWAAFTVHAALQLTNGGRLGFVLPAELLTSNYAAPVRRFLLDRFASVELMLFNERVFEEAETEAVLLLAAGYDESASDHVTVRRVRSPEELWNDPVSTMWAPKNPLDRWSNSAVDPRALSDLDALTESGAFTALKTWGNTRLGMVTGRNTYFALSPADKARLEIPDTETLPLSPPGSRHLRGLALTAEQLFGLGQSGKRVHLFRPTGQEPSAAARRYIATGEEENVDEAYKCRIRQPWWRVPLVAPADLLLTCMNADTVRMVTNSARAHHLNSVHGVYLNEEWRGLGESLLPLAALNSATMLSAELTGRSYGGGILKMEPGEAAEWCVPAPETVQRASRHLRALRPLVTSLLADGDLAGAVTHVDAALLVKEVGLNLDAVERIRDARNALAHRRAARGRTAKRRDDHSLATDTQRSLF